VLLQLIWRDVVGSSAILIALAAALGAYLVGHVLSVSLGGAR